MTGTIALLYLLATAAGGFLKSLLTLNILPAKKRLLESKGCPHDGWFPAEVN